jgi:hypothetical protein
LYCSALAGGGPSVRDYDGLLYAQVMFDVTHSVAPRLPGKKKHCQQQALRSQGSSVFGNLSTKTIARAADNDRKTSSSYLLRSPDRRPTWSDAIVNCDARFGSLLFSFVQLLFLVSRVFVPLCLPLTVIQNMKPVS